MTCPFLKEAQVKYCENAAVRKLIPLAKAGTTEEKCSSADYTSCAAYRLQPEEDSATGGCPFLRESLMQYCGAAPVTRFVPYSESMLSRCGRDSYRYCELYLAMAHPALASEEVDGIAVPGWLRYSANHMWVDVTDDGTCHIGVDGFLSRALGPVDRITYVWQKGRHRPAAVLSVAGEDVEVVFPNHLTIKSCNLYLQSDPSRISREPYTGGWLFEGVPEKDTLKGLTGGGEARLWIEQEHRRMNEFLQQASNSHGTLVADGGTFAEGVIRHLERERMLPLVQEFFSPLREWKE